MAAKSERGFGLIWILSIVTGVLLITFLIWFVVASNNSNKQVMKPIDTTDESDKIDDSNQPSLLTMYQSTRGGLTLHYPKAWLVTGYKNGQPVAQLDGDEDRLIFRTASDDTVKVDNFGAELRIADTAPGDTPWPTYPNGTVFEKLSNGIEVWRDNQVQTLQKGRVTNTCPTIRAASNDAFGYQLKNGKWLVFQGSFCWTPGLKTSYSYGQQRDSTQFVQAIDILRTIKQSPTP